MKHILLLLVLVWGCPAIAREFRPASLDKLTLDVHRYTCHREAMTPDIPCTQYHGGLKLNWDVGLLNDWLKWENTIHANGTYSAFATVGWEYKLSIPNRWGVEPFIHHHSQHVMDREQPVLAGQTRPVKFQVSDSYGLRVIFYPRK
jgi:hypothetical protein